MSITFGTATREGTALDNADAACVYRADSGTLGAAVIDGIGHQPGTSRIAPVLAEVAARVAAARGPLGGLLSAAELLAGEPDGGLNAVAVVAEIDPSDGFARIAWVGDARAYAWTPTGLGTGLGQVTTDQTMGQWARLHNEVPIEVAEHHDAWVRVSLRTAVVATVRQVEAPGPLIILTSDGVHDYVRSDALEHLADEYATDPQALADALVAAPEPRAGGYRDDATAVVIRIA
ncbi:hypothetical protein STTU_4917 [Streptomyces sp. Tu6071]|uniref:PP2C family protein-serine/threonine phosphatase n=1 Tax=Streptomyces sp. Tu6071 TaxID=355249 RepID=UPI00020E5FF9|nr:SpoIIE family protein phosphatase [Streptomyces sp. Tu6071]EGJ77706.1 hypothetical protein STTU_4917 [Streptomyces sp. Tu6071]